MDNISFLIGNNMSNQTSSLSFIDNFIQLTLTLNEVTYQEWSNKAICIMQELDTLSPSIISKNKINYQKIIPYLLDLSKNSNLIGVKTTSSLILNLMKQNGIANDYDEDIKGLLFDIFDLNKEEEDTITCKKENDDNETIMNGLDNFIDICKDRNNKGISVAVCDERGKFIIFDQLAETLYEQKKDKIFINSIFSLMIPLSYEYLRRKSDSLLSMEKNVFSYTIYSQNARKKYMKMITKSQKKNENIIDIKNSNEEITGVGIFYKFLKCLTSRVRKISLKLDKQTLLELLHDDICKEYPFFLNSEHHFVKELLNNPDSNSSSVWNCVLIETRIAKHIQKFNYLYMQLDSKIKTQEEKIIKKFKKKGRKESEGSLIKKIKFE